MTEEIEPGSVQDHKRTLLQWMTEKGIHLAHVGYSGYDDSGQIDEPVFSDKDGTEILLPMEKILLRDEDGEQCSKTVYEAFHSFCWDLLEDRWSGWEINDGSEGRFLFKPNDNEVVWEHTIWERTAHDTEEHL